MGTYKSPAGMASDAAGDLFVVDSGAGAIFKLTRSSKGLADPVTITSGWRGLSGIAVDQGGNVYFAETAESRIHVLPSDSASGTYGRPFVIGFTMAKPRGIAVDANRNVYVANSDDGDVIEIPWKSDADQFGPAVIVFKGLHAPQGVALDPSGNLYIADLNTDHLIRLPAQGSSFGAPVSIGAGFVQPSAIAVDVSGNLFVVDRELPYVVMLAKTGVTFGNQTTLASGLAGAIGVTVDGGGTVYVGDAGNSRVLGVRTTAAVLGTVDISRTSRASLPVSFSIDRGQTVSSVAVLTGGSPGLDFRSAPKSTCVPRTYAVRTDCVVNVAFKPLAPGTREGAVMLYAPSGKPIASARLTGIGSGPQVIFPNSVPKLLPLEIAGEILSVAVDGAGNLFLADNNSIIELLWNGSGFGDSVTVFHFDEGGIPLLGMTLDSAGDIFVSDSSGRVVVLPKLGNGFGDPTIVASGFKQPVGMAVDALGNVYVADPGTSRISKIPWNGSSFGPAMTLIYLTDEAFSPYVIAVDGAGSVFFQTGTFGDLIQLPWNGAGYDLPIVVLQSAAGLPTALGLAVDAAGDLLFSDPVDGNIYKSEWNGSGYDPASIALAGIDNPYGLAFNSHGDLLIGLYDASAGLPRASWVPFSAQTPINFDPTQVGLFSKDSPVSIPVENVGNQPLTLNSVTFPSSNFIESFDGSDLCQAQTVLTPRQTCSVTVSFNPQAAGNFTGKVTIADDALNLPTSKQTIVLTGTGTP